MPEPETKSSDNISSMQQAKQPSEKGADDDDDDRQNRTKTESIDFDEASIYQMRHTSDGIPVRDVEDGQPPAPCLMKEKSRSDGDVTRSVAKRRSCRGSFVL